VVLSQLHDRIGIVARAKATLTCVRPSSNLGFDDALLSASVVGSRKCLPAGPTDREFLLPPSVARCLQRIIVVDENATFWNDNSDVPLQLGPIEISGQLDVKAVSVSLGGVCVDVVAVVWRANCGR